MKKEYMDRILTWSESLCPLDTPCQYICLVMIGFRVPPLGESLSRNAKLTITRHLQHLACGAIAFVLWTRNYKLVRLKHGDINLDRTAIDSVFIKYLQGEEQSLTINDLNTYFEIHLKNRKGWQRKLDKGMKEVDLRGNHYQIYPRPDMGRACDAFLRLVLWMKWVEIVHLGQSMVDEDFLFPALGTNGVLQLGEPLSHDIVQKWINEAVAGAGIPRTFSTHCYHRGGAQYRFMFAPVAQRWTLARVWWWGGWADGEHRDTLMHYLLNELHCYENDHSDALRPISCEANDSFAGEAALVRPASTEALQMAHASLTANVAALHTTVKGVSSSQDVMSADVREMHQQLSDLTNLVTGVLSSTAARSASDLGGAATLACRRSPAWSTTLLPPTIQSAPAIQSRLSPTNSRPMRFTMPRLTQPSGASTFLSLPSQAGPQRTFPACPSNFPQGLLIPNVPVLHADGLCTPKSDSWKDIVCHWTEGEPRLGLDVALKDWPHHYYNGRHGWQFNSKYYQRSVVATEFLNEFEGNKEAFVKAYGTATCEGHTKLLKAILAARKRYHGDGERRRNLTNEVCDPPLDTLLNSDHEL
ncbi:hypothetical protein EDC04DRAFT_2605991 [Pisolithus marmoratus]|nr:hypothetical protein EDC04DRAFT_2605991 [Pisolithus marmoratus]